MGSTRYLHLDPSLCDAIKAERRKHIFFPVHDPFKATDDATLQQLDEAVQSETPWSGTLTHGAGQHCGELLACAVPATNAAEHATLQPDPSDAATSLALPSQALPGDLAAEVAGEQQPTVRAQAAQGEARQLALIVHGSTKRLIKGAADAGAQERLLRTMQAWARAHCLVSVHNGAVCITSVAHALCSEMGYTAAELLGCNLSVFMGPGTKEKLAAALVRRIPFLMDTGPDVAGPCCSMHSVITFCIREAATLGNLLATCVRAACFKQRQTPTTWVVTVVKTACRMIEYAAAPPPAQSPHHALPSQCTFTKALATQL